MTVPLNPHEQELLSALLDNALAGDERATADALLARPEARQYLEQLRALRALVATHGAARAPAGLKAGVIERLPETMAKVVALPAATWRTPLIALAAAVVVAIGLAFGPALFKPESTGGGVARDVAPANLAPATTDRDRAVGDTPLPSALGGPERDRAADESPKKTNANEMRREESSGAPGTGGGAGASDATRRSAEIPPGAPLGKNRAEDADKAKALDTEDRQANPPRDDRAKGGRGNDGSTADKAGGDAGEKAPSPSNPGPAEMRKDSKVKEEGANKETKDAADDLKETAEAKADDPARENAVVLALQPDSGLAAQNDVLRVGALYGSAKLSAAREDGSLEDIEIEVDAAKLPELLAALKRLATQQDYGKLSVPPALAGVVRDREQFEGKPKYKAESARDAMPSELRDRVESGPKARAAEKQGAAPSEGESIPPSAEPVPRKVRVKVELK